MELRRHRCRRFKISWKSGRSGIAALYGVDRENNIVGAKDLHTRNARMHMQQDQKRSCFLVSRYVSPPPFVSQPTPLLSIRELLSSWTGPRHTLSEPSFHSSTKIFVNI